MLSTGYTQITAESEMSFVSFYCVVRCHFFFTNVATHYSSTMVFADMKFALFLSVGQTGGYILVIERPERLATERPVQGNVARHSICKVSTMAVGR